MNTSHPHHRRLPLRSINNLRDLGGYQTIDGRTVCWHTLYRAGHLGKLKARDQRKLTALNLHTIIDFRSAEEKQRDPDRLPLNEVNVIELPILDEGNSAMMKDMRRRYENNDFDGLDTNLVMFNTYRQLALDFTAEYARFLQAVLQAQGQPVLWHCTAGKDRAGFAAALLLKILGVDFDTIQQDYLLSGKYIHPDRKLMAIIWLTKGAQPARLLKPLWAVKPEWIKASFDAIDEHWGSFDRYRREALAFSDEDTARLQELLLTEES
jgi:protein-tyrosine phosphatase